MLASKDVVRNLLISKAAITEERCVTIPSRSCVAWEQVYTTWLHEGCTMSDEDGLAQLVSSYGSDKSSSEDEQLEEMQCKTDQCDKIKTKDLKDGDNFYDNINNAEAR